MCHVEDITYDTQPLPLPPLEGHPPDLYSTLTLQSYSTFVTKHTLSSHTAHPHITQHVLTSHSRITHSTPSHHTQHTLTSHSTPSQHTLTPHT